MTRPSIIALALVMALTVAGCGYLPDSDEGIPLSSNTSNTQSVQEPEPAAETELPRELWGEHVRESIPWLDLVMTSGNSPEQHVRAVRMGSKWGITFGELTVTVNTDHAGVLQHRQEAFDDATLYLDNERNVIALLFSSDNRPDSISVQRWPAEYVRGTQDTGDLHERGEPVNIIGDSIHVSDDGQSYVYEVIATWAYSYVHYAFRTISR